MILTQDMLVVVRADHVGQRAVVDFFPVDDHRNLGLSREQILELGLNLRPLRRAGRVAEYGFIDRLWNAKNAVEHRDLQKGMCYLELVRQ